MADKDANPSNNNPSKWTCQSQRRFVIVKTEESSELDPTNNNNSTKRKRTPSVTIRSSPSTTDETMIGVWRENAVEPEAKKLFEAVEQKYPNTFQRLKICGKSIWLKMLKELYLVIKKFMEPSVDKMSEEDVISLQEDLNIFLGFGFDLSWALKRVEMVNRLKFGNEPLRKELMELEGSLETLKVEVSWRWKQLMEAHDVWRKARLEYDNATNDLDKKVEEMVEEFGAEYDRVLKGQLGLGMLPGY